MLFASHLWISESPSRSIFRRVCPSLCISRGSTPLYLGESDPLFGRVRPSVFRRVCPSVFRRVCPSVFWRVCPSVFRRVCPSLCISESLSLCILESLPLCISENPPVCIWESPPVCISGSLPVCISESLNNGGEGCYPKVDSNPAKYRSRVSSVFSQVQVQCCFTSTETIRTEGLLRPRTATSTFTQLLSSESALVTWLSIALRPQKS